MDATELHQLILKELECPVCYEYMEPPITICGNGHNICFACKPNLHRCPTCRERFLPVRNLSLEKISRHIGFPCSNNKAGCPELLPIHLLSEHQAECAFGSYRCPFSKISNVNCTRNCPITDLKSHVLRDHKGMSLEIYGGGKFYSHLSPLTHTLCMSKALLVFGELFYAVWKVIAGGLYCAVIYVGPENKSSKYTFRFTLTAINKIETVSTCLITKSYSENIHEILKPGNCIVVNYDTIKEMFAIENKLPFKLEISKLKRSNNGGSHNDQNYFNVDDESFYCIV